MYSFGLGPVMLDLAGLELSSTEKEILKHPQLGGIILFSRNYENPEQLTQLIKQIRQNSHTRLLIAVDHEGGRVQRFRKGFTALPALGNIGRLYEADLAKARICAEKAGWLMAVELLSFDIDFSFAPVLDLDKNISAVIGNRSFHRDPEIVIDLAQYYIQGMRQAGMAAVGKHFPGHGSVAADSHHEIPFDNRAKDVIFNDDLLPFIGLINNHFLDGIMPAHVVYSQLDSKPAGFSHFWLQTVLRQQLGFQGAIFSDDLSMVGASAIGSPAERAHLALDAGCDMILACNAPTDAYNILVSLAEHSDANHSLPTQRLLRLANANTYNYSDLKKTDIWRQAVKSLAMLNEQ